MTHAADKPTALAAVMAEQGRRQDWLAAQLGVSETLVSFWINGRYPVAHHHREPIAQALRRSSAELFADGDVQRLGDGG